MNIYFRLSLSGLALLVCSSVARDGRAEPGAVQRGKGLVGGGLLGAEIVVVTEAALGVKPAWAYIVGGVAGAGAGAVGGYYLAGDGSNKPSSFLLAGGIALAIPAVIGVLTATHFEPENYRQDMPTDEEPLFDDEAQPLEEPPSEEPSLEGLSPDEPPPPAARLELPSVELAQAFSREELQTFRVRQATEVHVSVLRGTF